MAVYEQTSLECGTMQPHDVLQMQLLHHAGQRASSAPVRPPASFAAKISASVARTATDKLNMSRDPSRDCKSALRGGDIHVYTPVMEASFRAAFHRVRSACPCPDCPCSADVGLGGVLGCVEGVLDVGDVWGSSRTDEASRR